MAAKKTQKTQRTVRFEITTAQPLAVGQQVFVSGNVKPLGNWRPDALPLTRMGENLWMGQAIVPVSEALEFKITRGSWATEAVSATGVVPGNHTLRAGGDATARHTVVAWRDHVA